MSNYTNSLYKDYEKLVVKNKNLSQENKFLKLQIDIAESEQQRLEKINFQKEKQIVETIIFTGQ